MDEMSEKLKEQKLTDQQVFTSVSLDEYDRTTAEKTYFEQTDTETSHKRDNRVELFISAGYLSNDIDLPDEPDATVNIEKKTALENLKNLNPVAQKA